MVGHFRSMFHPVVRTAHLTAFENLTALKRFAVLSIGSDSQYSATQAPHFTKQSFVSHFAADLTSYDFAKIHIMDSEETFSKAFFGTEFCEPPLGSCASVNRTFPIKDLEGGDIPDSKPLCNQKAMEKESRVPETPENYAEQIFKAARCGRMIETFEKSNSMAFQWVIKTRPDFVMMEAFPPLASFPSRKQVYVNKFRPDHFFVCSRDKCNSYLFKASELQLSCRAGFDFGLSSFKKIGFVYSNREVNERAMEFEYSRFRENGPMCHRNGGCAHGCTEMGRRSCLEFSNLTSKINAAGSNATSLHSVAELVASLVRRGRAGSISERLASSF
jgi:hypothetical protein